MDVIEVLKAKTDGMPDEVVITLTTQQGKTLLDHLEAERQRTAGSEEELHKALHREKAEERKLLAALEEIAALKGDQVPVYQMYYDGFWRDVDKEHYEHFKEKGSDVRLLFTAPQKPVVLPEIISALYRTSFHESYRAIEVYRMNDVKAAIKAAGGIVKDGE